MKELRKRICAVALSLALLVGCFYIRPLSTARAADPGAPTPTPEDERLSFRVDGDFIEAGLDAIPGLVEGTGNRLRSAESGSDSTADSDLYVRTPDAAGIKRTQADSEIYSGEQPDAAPRRSPGRGGGTLSLTLDGDGYYKITSQAELNEAAVYTQTCDTTAFKIKLAFDDPSYTLDDTFPGFGSENYPFRGEMVFFEGTTWDKTFYLWENPLFHYLSTEAQLLQTGSNTLTLVMQGSRGGLAQVLVAEGTGEMILPATLGLECGTSSGETGVQNDYISGSGLANAGALFGIIIPGGGEAAATSAAITVNATVESVTVAALNIGDAGGLVGRVSLPTTLTLGGGVSLANANVTALCGSAGGLVGCVDANASTTITINSALAASGASILCTTGGAGGLVGTVNSALSVLAASGITVGGKVEASTRTGSTTPASNGPGHAGGLVGRVNEAFTKTGSAASSAAVSAGEAAGGAFGYVAAPVSLGGSLTVQSAMVQSDVYAGGYIGLCMPPQGAAYTLSFSSGSSITAEVYPLNTEGAALGAGGLLGGLFAETGDDFQSLTVDLANLTLTPTLNLRKLGTASDSLSIGGVCGRARAGALTQTLTFTNLGAITAALSDVSLQPGMAGGVLGFLEESSYCAVSGSAASIVFSCDTINKDKNGALAGELANGAVLDLSCSLSYNHRNYGADYYSVLVGITGEGSILRLRSTLTDNSGYVGCLVKKQNKSLVYAETGFAFSYTAGASIKSDDIGNYGQLIRNDARSIDGEADPIWPGGIISFDTTEHTAALNGPLSVTAGGLTLSNALDFAKLAITLSSDGVFSGVKNTGGVLYSSANVNDLLRMALTVGGDIDLRLSGIEQLTRSDAATTYRGEITGNGKTITLDIGARCNENMTEGLFSRDGGHIYLGLFSCVKNAKVNNLTVAGSIRVSRQNSRNIQAGGLAGYASYELTMTNCTTRLNVQEGRGGENAYYGGFVGRLICNSKKLTMTSCTADASFSIYSENNIKRATAYTGGFLGYVDLKTNAAVDFSGSTIHTEIREDNGSPATKAANVGGIAAVLMENNANSNHEINMTGVTASDVVIDVSSSVSVGGILGHSWGGLNWGNVDLTLDGSFDGDVTNRGTGGVGGLAYLMSGRCKLAEGFSITGNYTSQNPGTEKSDGLLVNQGMKLYMPVFCEASALSGAVINNAATNRFDRLVGNNIKERVNGVASHGGIVSIETTPGKANAGFIPAADATGWDELFAAAPNQNTRYYYNVDTLNHVDAAAGAGYSVSGDTLSLTDDADGYTAAGKLLAWHLANYVDKDTSEGNLLLRYFTKEGGLPSTVTAAADVDMQNRCLYPTARTESTTFDFNNHTLTFFPPDWGAITETQSQNYGVQTGLLLSLILGENTNANLTMREIKLAGKISHLGSFQNAPDTDSSGALVVMDLAGHYDETPANRSILTVDLRDIALSGIGVCGIDQDTVYAPLLVGRFKTQVAVSINGITDKTLSDDTVIHSYADAASRPAAVSLLGYGGYIQKVDNVDQVASRNVNINLGKPGEGRVAVEGLRTADGSTPAGYFTSEFTKATLFTGLYNSTDSYSDFQYNFEEAETVTAPVSMTYGQELTPTTGYYNSVSGQTVSNPVDASDTEFDLFIPYVSNAVAGALSGTLEVNNKYPELDHDNYGTYEHPYLIANVSMLKLYNDILTIDNLKKFTIYCPADYNSQEGWAGCDWTTCDRYAYENGQFTRSYLDATNEFVVADTNEMTLEALREWLLGAYYLVDTPSTNTTNRLELGDLNFNGFGTETAPFHGVIKGVAKDGIPATVQMPDVGTAKGLVNVANGCAVIGVRIEYTDIAPLNGTFSSATADPAADALHTSTAYPYFGGAIGWVVGGDNLLKDVEVAINSFTPGQEKGILGGYVGLVSGGGVIFSGHSVMPLPMSGASLTGMTAHGLYYNPYVGRVLNGYAIADENVAYNNAMQKIERNSCITPVYATNNEIEYANSTLTVDSNEELLLLSYAINSGFLTTASDNPNSAGAYGRSTGSLSRWGDYGAVGSLPASGITDGKYKDDQFSAEDSYLGHYFNSIPNGNALVDVMITSDCDLSGYGCGFHGLGGMYPSTPVLNIREVSGGAEQRVINFDMDFFQYYQNSALEPDLAVNLGLVPQTGSNGLALSQLWAKGTVSLQLTDGVGGSTDVRFENYLAALPESGISVGALAGYAKISELEDITLGAASGSAMGQYELTLRSPDYCGGLVGRAEFMSSASMLTDCCFNRIDVSGKRETGGLIGWAKLVDGVSVTFGSSTPVACENSRIQFHTPNFEGIRNDSSHNADAEVPYYKTKSGASNGVVCVGGVIGLLSGGTATVQGFRLINNAVLFRSWKTSSNTNEMTYVGAVVGRRYGPATLQDLESYDNIVLAIANKSSAMYIDDYIADESNDFVTQTGFALQGTPYDEATKSLTYLLREILNLGTKVYGGYASGILGGACDNTIFTNCAVASQSGMAVIVGMNDSGGLLANHRKNADCTITVEGCSVKASTDKPLFIVSTSHAAGLLAYASQGATASYTKSWTFSNCQVGGADDSSVFILGTGGQRAAVGVFTAESDNASTNISVTNSSATNVRISGYRGGAVTARTKGGVVTCNGLTVSGCDFYVPKRGSGDVGNKLELSVLGGLVGVTDGTCYFNNITLETTKLYANGKNICTVEVGGLVGKTVSSTRVYGNAIVTKDNLIGQADRLSTEWYPFIKNEIATATFVSNVRSGYVGLVVGENAGTVSVVGFNRFYRDTDPANTRTNPPDTGNENTGSTKTIVYAGYGATTTSTTGTEHYMRMDAQNQVVTNAQQLTYQTHSWQGESVGKVGDVRTPSVLQDVLWFSDNQYAELDSRLISFETQYNDPESPGSPALTDQLADLTLLLINGDADDTVRGYLNLLTNGGSEAPGVQITATTSYYQLTYGTETVNGVEKRTAELTLMPNHGSVAYDNGSFVSGDRYDLVKRGGGDNDSFTKLTVTFINPCAAGANASYALDILVYYPQVLEMCASIHALSKEEYHLDTLLENSRNAAYVTGAGTATLLLTYTYNEVRKNDPWNLEKSITFRTSRNELTEDETQMLPAGTKLTLLDLNYYKTEGDDPWAFDMSRIPHYYYLVPQNDAENCNNTIAWNDFLPGGSDYPYVALDALKDYSFQAGDESKGGIEQYILVVEYPAAVDGRGLYIWPEGDDASHSHNVTVNKTQEYATLTSFNAPTVNLNMESSVGEALALRTSQPGEALLQAAITYQSAYPDGVNNQDNNYKLNGLLRLQLKNGDAAVCLPAKTKWMLTYTVGEATYLAAEGALDGDTGVWNARLESVDLLNGSECSDILALLRQPTAGNPQFATLESGLMRYTLPAYTLTLDFSEVELADFSAAFADNETCTLNGELFITPDLDLPESGYCGRDSLICSADVQSKLGLAIRVPSEKSMNLGVNLFDSMDETNVDPIEFTVATDLTALSATVGNLTGANMTLQLSLYRKDTSGKYVPVRSDTTPNLGDCLDDLRVTGGSALTATNGVYLVPWAQGGTAGFTYDATNNTFNCPMQLQVNRETQWFSNYKLEATLTVQADEQTLTGTAYFIYTVAKIKNIIAGNQFI